MNVLFKEVVDMSLTASWMILAVLIIRFVLKKAPKWIHVVLWGIVAVRLVCPFSVESTISLIPDTSEFVSIDNIPETEIGQISDEETFFNRTPILDNEESNTAGWADQTEVTASARNSQMQVLPIIWLLGIITMSLYTMISYFRLRYRLNTAVLYKDNIFQSEHVRSPFVLGIIRPRIYLPFRLKEQDAAYVIAHEKVHLQRMDHWWKLLGFMVLSVHWFNPMVWLAYSCLCKDIELACDEKVIKALDDQQRADYTQVLVSLSFHRRRMVTCPLAFGEVGIKERVRSIMKYKKPAFWIVALAIISCFVLTACFLTDPKQEEATENSDSINIEETGEESEEQLENETSVETETSEQNEILAEIVYQLELSSLGKEFEEMDTFYKEELLEEYGPLLDGYLLTGRESIDGATAYVVGLYEGEPENNPFYSMHMMEVGNSSGEFQLIYDQKDEELVNNKLMDPSFESFDAGYVIRNSYVSVYSQNGIVMIQPKTVELNLHDAMSMYLRLGPSYIPDAVSRGIAIHIPKEPYLSVYLISEKYGEISENIPLTEEQAKEMLEEKKEMLPEGVGFSAGLNVDGEKIYFSETAGVPQSMLDLAVERCGYKFGTPKDITDPIKEARLDCNWLEEPVYANENDLELLKEILSHAEFDFVGGCGYGAKLTVTLNNGEQVVMFKGCDSCDSMVFGSYGGYYLGDDENLKFWEIFGLDPETKEYR